MDQSQGQGQLGFADDRFWDELGDDEGRLSDQFGERKFDGLLLDGPRQVPLSSRGDLPLVGVRGSTIADNVTLSIQRRLVLVVSRLESDEVCAATAFRINDDMRGRPRTPKDPAKLPKGRTVKVFRLSARERLDDLPWRAGHLQAQLLLFDQRSNAVTVRLAGTADNVQDPAVRDFLASQRRPAYPPAIWPSPVAAPGERAPYRARPDSPDLPREVGIALAADRVIVKGPATKAMLRGSFNLPVLERDVVREQPAPADRNPDDGVWVDVGDPAATAVMPISLILSGDTVADPIVLAMQVPVYGGGGPGQLAAGHFAIDLFGSLPGLEPQTYAVWAVSRAVTSKPALVGVVSRDMLPRPGER